MTSALSNFRDIVQLLHRVVRPDVLHSHDLQALVDKIYDALSKADDCGCGPCEPIRVEPFPFSELLRPPTPPTLVIHPEQDAGEIIPNVIVTKEEPEVPEIRNVVVSAPTFVHAVKLDSPAPPKPTPVLTAIACPPSDVAILHDLHRDEEEDDVSTIKSIGDDTPTATSEAEASEDESMMDEMEEEAEDEEEEEVEEEEDDDLELKMIKKQNYYWSPSSKRIYECLEEGYGDCLGTYDGGKIIPKA